MPSPKLSTKKMKKSKFPFDLLLDKQLLKQLLFLIYFLTLHNMFRLSGPGHMPLLTEQKIQVPVLLSL